MRPGPAARARALAVVLAVAALAAAAASCGPRSGRPRRSPREPSDALSSIASSSGGRYDSVRRDLPGRLAAELREACPRGAERALVLVIDDTESMAGHLDDVRRSGPLLVEAAGRGCRIAVIAYRDHRDEFTLRRLVDFGDPAEKAVEALRELAAEGGGDWAEPVWLALDAATAAAAEPGLPAHVVLIADAPGHLDPDAAARVRARLADGRTTLSVLDILRMRPTPEPEPEHMPRALAGRFGARHVVLSPGDCGAEVARLLREAIETPGPGPAEAALVVPLGLPRGGTASLDEAAGAARALEAAGGALAIVGYGALEGGAATAVLAPLRFRGAAAEALALPREKIALAGAASEGRTGPLEGLAAAAALPWTAERPHLVILIDAAGSDADPALEEAVGVFLGGGSASLVVLDVSGGREAARSRARGAD